jgi:hypothetical protein
MLPAYVSNQRYIKVKSLHLLHIRKERGSVAQRQELSEVNHQGDEGLRFNSSFNYHLPIMGKIGSKV